MPKLIKNRRLVEDEFSIKWSAEESDPSGKLLVSLEEWQARRDELLASTGTHGVWLKPDDEPELLVEDLSQLPVIAVQFPAFTDGRGYSLARLLRERYGYEGELRAVGDVLRDQLFYMHRCGFDSFAIREDRDAEDALAALDEFSDVYQSAVQQPLPLFRRR
ncbi:DUF934 domain-containing protein [Aestuariirhabdus litorea]|uniref:DUF934 domain-containing protein n=1 Tax=Aestuariirhabdus litorea TaxID=2528527 RepID=A0A3P3VQI8_9GAMM|nr:DUF934 domain-containing protein [Aestuariirhabdus litorea]RRJ84880.1 DUF934 domain-containing protein [Aestuariirhabdus litorea]RWW98106.1 DUF934 domain-containing protein [Endozoicomonadaceae bacterium GTF-13]